MLEKFNPTSRGISLFICANGNIYVEIRFYFGGLLSLFPLDWGELKSLSRMYFKLGGFKK